MSRREESQHKEVSHAKQSSKASKSASVKHKDNSRVKSKKEGDAGYEVTL